MDAAIKSMIVIMMDANHISERLASMRQTISDLRVINARYWVKSQHTALDKSAHALREGKLLGIQARIVGHDETLCLEDISHQMAQDWIRPCFLVDDAGSSYNA